MSDEVSAASRQCLRECTGCGLFQAIPPLRPGTVAECLRCGELLRRRRRDSLDVTLALNLAGLVLFGIAIVFPLFGMNLRGLHRDTSIPLLPLRFEQQGLWQLGLVVLGTILVAPVLRLALTVGAILGLRLRWRADVLAACVRWRVWLAPWAMTEVFLLGAFVAYTRLAAIATVQVGLGVYALGALMLLTVMSDAWLDEQALWEAIGRRRMPSHIARAGATRIGCDACGVVSRQIEGSRCSRCDAVLHRRKPNSLARTWALLTAAVLCYVPANLYPVMTVVLLGRGHPSTILGGVQELIESRMWPLALLVFIASVLVPLLKLAGLSYMLITTQRGSQARLLDRTRLYRLVDFVGRWSMIDVFMVSILVALVQMGVLAQVTPGFGGVFFAAVVILTMSASFSFDPRLMWDAAGVSASGVPGSGVGGPDDKAVASVRQVPGTEAGAVQPGARVLPVKTR